MLAVLVALLSLFAASTTAQSHESLVSNLIARQASAIPSNCNATCGTFAAVKKACHAPHCGCTVDFLQAQVNCLVCQSQTAPDVAAVQFLIDTETNACRSSGVPVDFHFDLPPDAAALVHKFNQDSAELRREQRAFLGLQISGGHIGLVIVLLFSVFSRNVRRDPTYLNFCITWIFSSIVFSILLYRGTDGNTVVQSLGNIPDGKCLAQAALTNGAQVMTACSTMALVIKLWIGLRSAIHGDIMRGPKQTQWITIALLVAPYVLFLVFAIPSVLVGRVQVNLGGVMHQRALPANFYCTVIELSPFLQAIYGVTLGLLIITLIFDVLIITVLYRHWWSFRHVQTKNAISLSILLRVMAFSIFRVVVAVAYGTVLNAPPVVQQAGSNDTLAVTFGAPAWVDLLQAALPLVGFLVLGVNSELLNAMMFWRRFGFTKRRVGAVSTMESVQTAGTSTVNSVREWNEKAVLEADTKYVNVPV